MLVIRAEQMAALARASTQQFEDQLVAHLLKWFPDECRVLGLEDVRRVIQEGTRKAARYGLELQRDLCRYIDLMFLLGMDFDTALPWAHELLTAPEIPQPTLRLERTFTEASRRLRARS